MKPTTKNMMRAYYRWMCGHKLGGFDRHWEPSGAKAAASDRYRSLVKRRRRDARWTTRKIMPYGTDEDIACEHCLGTGSKVVLMVPAVVSGHVNGDWVCGKCEPRVTTLLLMDALEDLVVTE